MEHNFASSMPTGTTAPFLQESILKDYTTEAMESLAFSSVSPYDFIPFDLASVHQGFMNVYFHVVESANTRSIAGAGIIAAAIVYGVWKSCDGWNKHVSSAAEQESDYDFEGYHQLKGIEAVEDSPGAHMHTLSEAPTARQSLPKYPETKDAAVYCRLFQSKSTDTEELSAMSENFHRQLKDALSRLDDVLYKLKEIEKDKELLSAEIDVRKEMIHKLQAENTAEREKRQKAELKMEWNNQQLYLSMFAKEEGAARGWLEMMGMENSQIRQLRKEIDIKSSQVEKLETLMKEKDDIQMKLFENNIVLPRNVVEARAREFSELQNRVLHLQAEIDSARRIRNYDIECQPCGLSKSVWLEAPRHLPALRHSEAPTATKKTYHNGTPITLSQSRNKKLANTKLRLAERSPRMVRELSRSTENASKLSRINTSPSLILDSNSPSDGKSACNMFESKSVTNTSVSPFSTPGKPADLQNAGSSLHRKNIGVFAQIRALVGNFRDNNSESNSANLALLKDLGSLLNSDRAHNNRLTNKENPLSDEQSSVFMSASGGSDGSDIDEFGMQGRNARKSHSKKVASLRRLSRYRRGRRRDNMVVKRRLAVQYFDGQAHLIGLGETPALPSLSHEQSHGSLVKHYPTTTTAGRIKCAADGLESNLDCSVSKLKICDANNAHGGDSWILIIPKGTS